MPYFLATLFWQAVSKARSGADTALIKVKDALRAAIAEAEAATTDVDAGANKDQLAIPTNLVKSRLLFAWEVLNDTDYAAESLADLIASV